MLLRVKYYIRAALGLVVIISLQASVLAAPREVVKWSELGEHLIEKSVAIESMSVIDCPVAVASESAEHLVCQVIENTFYKWREYEFFNAAGETRLAIEMIKPEARFLTAAEAQVLLNGSKLWEHQPSESLSNNLTVRQSPVNHRKTKNPIPRIQRTYQETIQQEVSVDSFRDPKLKMVPSVMSITEIDDELVTREFVLGADDRERVTSIATITNYPWNTICYLGYFVDGVEYGGTGVMIAPHCVLTCAHNLWDQDKQVWSSSVAVTPAQFQDYQWGTIYEPFGTVYDTTLASNSAYVASSGGFEYDYGVVQFDQSFPGISTFMPIVYDATTNVVNIAGYPGVVQNEINSYDMWLGSGGVLGYEGISDRIMLHQVDTSGGQSGSPVWVYNSFTMSRRLVAIHVYGSFPENGACRLVSTMEPLISAWMEYEPVSSYTHFSYIPYFSTTSSRWTGLALANYNNGSNDIKVDYYAANGNSLGSEQKSFAAYEKKAFPTATAVGTEGWVKISSTAPLKGLVLIGDSAPGTMYDIDLKDSLHRKFLFPHLASNGEWNSYVMICNPNNSAASISFKNYNSSGTPTAPTTRSIPANGSVKYAVSTLFDQDFTDGTMVLESSQPVTAFLLNDNESQTWKAGLSAVPVD